MAERKNPFAGFIPEVSKAHDPNHITLANLEKYNSLEHEKLDGLFKVLKKSRLYIGGVLCLCVWGAWYGERKARN